VTVFERIATGYRLAEAPVASPAGGVYFSDVLGGGVHEWSPTTGDVTTVIPKRRGVGGMALHADGGLVVTGRDVSHVRDGQSRSLFADDTIAGMNDMTVDPDGQVVVGILRFRPFAGESPVPGEFITVGRQSTSLVTDGILWANGCAFSPDGDTFYGIDYQRGLVLGAARRGDGTYEPSRVVVTSPSGHADGMAVDEMGALWVALADSGTVGRFTPDGVLDAEFDVPAKFVASVCFGGTDGRDLFVTTPDNTEDPDAGGAVFRGRVSVAGAPITAVTI
jgi:gluconolactonase